MTLQDFIALRHGKTDIDVVQGGTIVVKIKYDAQDDEFSEEITQAQVEYYTAVDYRTIEVGIE